MSSQRNMHNLALIGFMGTGKSSVGRLVASHLHFQFMDTDEWIETQTGKSISDIFKQAGEAVFRQVEKQVVSEVSQLRKYVLSTGGGLAANGGKPARPKTPGPGCFPWGLPGGVLESGWA